MTINLKGRIKLVLSKEQRIQKLLLWVEFRTSIIILIIMSEENNIRGRHYGRWSWGHAIRRQGMRHLEMMKMMRITEAKGYSWMRMMVVTEICIGSKGYPMRMMMMMMMSSSVLRRMILIGGCIGRWGRGTRSEACWICCWRWMKWCTVGGGRGCRGVHCH